MDVAKKQSSSLSKLIAQLDEDRAFLLQQIDLGKWPELRHDLAALERELGQLLNRAADEIEQK